MSLLHMQRGEVFLGANLFSVVDLPDEGLPTRAINGSRGILLRALCAFSCCVFTSSRNAIRHAPRSEPGWGQAHAKELTWFFRFRTRNPLSNTSKVLSFVPSGDKSSLEFGPKYGFHLHTDHESSPKIGNVGIVRLPQQKPWHD